MQNSVKSVNHVLCCLHGIVWTWCLVSVMGPLAVNKYNNILANAKRRCHCSMLCLRPISTLCSCSHCILDVTSFGSADSVRRASNNGVSHFKPIFQVEGNTFRPIFFGYFIVDWLLYNNVAGSFHTTKLCTRLYSTEIEFYSKKLKNRFLSQPLEDLGVTYALHV